MLKDGAPLQKGALFIEGDSGMLRFIKPGERDLPRCAEAYLSAYGTDPWNETYDKGKIEACLSGFCSSDSMRCFAAEENGEIIGLALVLVVPGIDAPYFRVEDFCISAGKQRKGYGTLFLKSIFEEALKAGCDSVLLGTQREFPSHKFYLKNGFSEIESVLLYRPLLEQADN